MSLTIAETAARTGLTAHTLRYYERDGLMLAVDRSASGHRRYTDIDLDWIELITRLRTTGMPIRARPATADSSGRVELGALLVGQLQLDRGEALVELSHR